MSGGYDSVFRRFKMEGRSKRLKRLYETYEHVLTIQMKDAGYVPVLDLEVYYTAKYDRESDEYDVVVSMQGVYVGVEEAKQCQGMMYGKTLEHHIQNLPSVPSSKDWD